MHVAPKRATDSGTGASLSEIKEHPFAEPMLKSPRSSVDADIGWNSGDAAVPYASIEDLPPPIREYLPPHAREIYRSAFNNAWDEYAGRGERREEIAHRVAWAAVKHRYRKEGNAWVPL